MFGKAAISAILKKLSMLWIALGLYICLNAGIYLLQRFIVFQPRRLPAGHVFAFDRPFEEIFITTGDGVKINALYFPTQLDRRGTILYFHGNAGNLQRWGRYHTDFTNRGYDLLMIDYRGYGKSGGRPSEQGLYLDGEAAYRWLRKRVPPDQLLLYGRSLGSGVACYLAGRFEARMLLLETPFDSVTGALRKRFPFFFFPFRMKHDFPNHDHLKNAGMPVYIFHGARDEIVPYASARRLEPLLDDPSCFTTIQKGMHKNLRRFAAYQRALDDILSCDEQK